MLPVRVEPSDWALSRKAQELMQGEGCTGDLACGGIDGNSFKHTSTPPEIHSAAVGPSISSPFSSSGVRAGVTAFHQS